MFSSYYPYPPAQWKTRSHFSSRPRGQLGWPTSNGIRRTERKLETIDIKHRDNMGRTQLHHAVLRADVVLVKHVLEMHGDVHAYDDTGYQPLHCIVLDGVGKDFKSFAANSREIIQALCSAGAIVDSQDGQGLTTLHAAFVKGSLSVVCALLEVGANPNARWRNDIRPLHHIADALETSESIDVKVKTIQAMVDVGADVNAVTVDGVTPLYRAVTLGSSLAVQLLLEAGANPDFHHPSRFPPIHYAIESLDIPGGADAIHALLRGGADIHAPDASGNTALHRAIAQGSLAATQLLLDAGADPDFHQLDGPWPLHFIIEALNTPQGEDAVSALLQKGADPNAVDLKGVTPLHCAIRYGSPAAVRLLLGARADPDYHLPGKIYPLHYIVEGLKTPFGQEALQILLQAGIDLNPTNADGLTPLHFAVVVGSPSAVRFLLDAGADPNFGARDGSSPLHFITQCLTTLQGGETIAALLECSSVDLNSTNSDGLTPLHLAIKHGSPRAVRILLEARVDMNFCVADGPSPLHLIVRSLETPHGAEAVTALLQAGANLHRLDSNHFTPLHVAVKAGSLDAVRLLLDAGVDPNFHSGSGPAPLHLVVDCLKAPRGEEVIAALLQAGAGVHFLDSDHLTPLHVAVKQGSPAAVRLLLEAGADPNYYTSDGPWPLHLIVEALDTEHGEEAVRALLEAGANPNGLPTHGLTPLHRAFANGSLPAVRMLLQAGADPNIHGPDGLGPLHFIMQSLHTPHGAEAAVLLLQAGADPNAMHAGGLTPLHKAVKEGSPAAVRLLLDGGADPDYHAPDGPWPLHFIIEALETPLGLEAVEALVRGGADLNSVGPDGFTPLHRAVEEGSLPAVRFLLGAGADPNFHVVDGYWPFHLVVEALTTPHGSEIVSALLESGADPNAVGARGRTPLHRAVVDGLPLVVRVLLQSGADPNFCHDDWPPPLYFIIESLRMTNGVEAIRALLQGGANPNTFTSDGTTPLHRAVQKGSPSAVRMLLGAGADPNFHIPDKPCPIHHIIQSLETPGGMEAIGILLQEGADPNVLDPHGYSPLHFAIKWGSPSAARLLLDAGADPNLHRADRPWPLHYIIESLENPRGTEAVQTLLQAGADVDALDSRGLAPLHLAVSGGSPMAVQLLLQAGADPNIRRDGALAPIHFLAESLQNPQGVEAINALLQGGADPNALDLDDLTPLHHAVKACSPTAVRLLLQAGAKPNNEVEARSPIHAIDELIGSPNGSGVIAALLQGGANPNVLDTTGLSPLHRAVKWGALSAVQLLLNAGADSNFHAPNTRWPLHYIVESLETPDGAEIAILLLEAGAEPNALDGVATPLHLAVREGSISAVEILLQAGADPNFHETDGPSPIHLVVEAMEAPHGEKAVLALIEAGADVNVLDSGGIAPLHRAVAEGSPSAVQLLLQAGADPDLCDAEGPCPLHFIIESLATDQGEEAVASLLEAGADINPLDANDHTPLHRAIAEGSLPAVQFLLEAGADPDFHSINGLWPLHFVIESLQTAKGADAVTALLQYGADVNGFTPDGYTPLHRAIELGSPAAVKFLCTAGANPNFHHLGGLWPLHLIVESLETPGGADAAAALINAGARLNDTDPQDGMTPLHRAIQMGSPSAVRLLLEKGVNPDTHRDGMWSPLHLAVEALETPLGADAIEALIRGGASVNAMNADGFTPLHRAIQMGSPSAVHALLLAGANPDAHAADGPWPLHFIVECLETPLGGETLDALFLADANPNASTPDGYTPLHRAVEMGSPLAVRVLLQLGADPNFHTNSYTPLHHIVESLRCPDGTEAVAALLEGGADPSIPTKTGVTPLDRAIKLCSPAAVRMLLEAGATSLAQEDIFWPIHHAAEVFRTQDGQKAVAAIGGPGSVGPNRHAALYRAIDLGDSLPDNPELFRETLQLIGHFRAEMLHPEVLRRNDCIAALAMLYAAYGFYPDDPILQEYEVVKTSSAPISRSGFGLCWKGLFLGKHKVAVKGLRSHQNEERTTKLLERETEIWRRLNHTHVLRFIGLCALDDEMYVVSPWMDNGDAPSYIQRNPHADCVELLLQVALGLEYLHTFSPTVVHGDLRGANILISSLGHAQISDFGLSHMVDDKDGHSYSAAWFNAGSPRWLAPELLAKDNSSEAVWRTTASDVFSFGRLILELTSGRIPFFETVDDGLVRLKVGEGEIPERPQDEDALARGLDEDMWGLAVECWHREPSMRPIAQDLVHHLEALLQARGGSLPLEI